MKYSATKAPLVCIMTNSSCYQGTKTMVPKGILWHSTGCNNPTLRRYVQPTKGTADYSELIKTIGKNTEVSDWNNTKQSAGVNAWIGKLQDGTVAAVQTLPWTYRPWGCGSGSKGSCNDGFIQFEICEDNLKDKTYFEAAYKEACELTAYLCKVFKIDPNGSVKVGSATVPTILCHADGYKLGVSSNHSDVYNWFDKYGKTMNDVRSDVAKLLGVTSATPSVLKASQLKGLSEAQAVEKVGKFFTEDEKKSGILACVSMAQFIQESGYGSTELAQNANNCFGMKTNLSGNTWANSTWDGKSVYTKKTPEQKPNGTKYYIIADFRKYPSINDSIADHSAYLTGAMNGSKKRYAGLVGEKDYKKAISIIKKGGYATDVTYESSLCNIIERWNLTRFNANSTSTTTASAFKPYLVRVEDDALNVRFGPGTNYKVNMVIRDRGTYTIVDEQNGWGKLKSGAGWISLNYTSRRS